MTGCTSLRMLATIIFFGVFIALWLLFHFVLKPRIKFAKIINKLPGATTYPIIGNSYIFIGTPRKEIFTRITEYNKKYGPLCRNWMGSVPFVHISKPDHIEIILKSSVNISKGKVYDNLQPWLGNGILLSTGRKWHQRRELLSEAFHFQILESFAEIFAEKSGVLVDKLENHADGKVFDIYPLLTDFALDVISETAIDVKIDAMNNPEHSEYAEAVSKLCEFVIIKDIKPWLKLLFLPFLPYGKEMKKCLSTVHNFTKSVIAERRLTRFSKIRKIEHYFGKKRRVSFLDILLDASEDDILLKLSDTEIREEVETIMFAGHHTTAVSIYWTLFLLGNNLDIQERVYDEINNVMQNRKCPSDIKDLNKLRYLECIIKESLRLYPSVPVVIRKLSEDIYLDGYQIPQNCQVVLQIYDVHRNPEYWDDPNDFDPTRFYPVNSLTRHPYSYIPFSAGQRNCIGQRFAMYEEKMVLASILKNYKVKSVDAADDVKPAFEVILKPSGPVRMIFEKRH